MVPATTIFAICEEPESEQELNVTLVPKLQGKISKQHSAKKIYVEVPLQKEVDSPE